ncbi:MAG: hypothetical protein B7Z65_09215 [Ferrovum sp. 21-44-67]|nr:MAG: hypothetical protein B7Z65_09215 [Ferrovum sp. 21-44-67]
MVLRVPNVCGSPLFFENREQKRIERWEHGPNLRRAVSDLAHAEWAGTLRSEGQAQKLKGRLRTVGLYYWWWILATPQTHLPEV